MSEIETVRLVSTFFSMADSKFNCSACLKRFSKQFRDEKKGCNVNSSKPIAKYHDFYNFYRCPGSLKNKAYSEVASLFSASAASIPA